MPLVSDEGEGGEVGVAELDPFGLVGSLPFGEPPQAALGRRDRDRLDEGVAMSTTTPPARRRDSHLVHGVGP